MYPNKCDIKLIALPHTNIQKIKLIYLMNIWAIYHSAKLSHYFLAIVHFIKCENFVQMFYLLVFYTIYLKTKYILVLYIIFSNLNRNFNAVSFFLACYDYFCHGSVKRKTRKTQIWLQNRVRQIRNYDYWILYLKSFATNQNLNYFVDKYLSFMKLVSWLSISFEKVFISQLFHPNNLAGCHKN